MQVITRDLYCGAYILGKGGVLKETKLSHHGGRSSVTFIFTSHQAAQLLKEFESGQAIIHLSSFKVAMTHLKDTMFAILRGESPHIQS